MIFILIFVEICLYFDTIHNFSVCLRTGSTPGNIVRFGSHTAGKTIVPVGSYEACVDP